uniref:helix-turn-helix domain-containing protein n=1 Tax=Methylobacterium sp. B1 TaxID=91459 RepID=UPI002074A60E
MSGVVEQESLFLTDLGRRVRHARTVRGLSRKVLSQTSGLSERYIAQLEGGQGNVSIILLRRVANAMGVRLDDLITGNDGLPDWPVVRDLLAQASPAQIAAAKDALSGGSRPESSNRPRVALIGLRGAGKCERMSEPEADLDREATANRLMQRLSGFAQGIGMSGTDARQIIGRV